MTKFGFTIRTRDGGLVDNLLIQGRDQVEAETKLRQVYRHCKIINVRVIAGSVPDGSTDLESLITLIAAEQRKP
jgi:hypothetical protein